MLTAAEEIFSVGYLKIFDSAFCLEVDDNKQIFDKKNRISKIIQSSLMIFDEAKLSRISSSETD